MRSVYAFLAAWAAGAVALAPPGPPCKCSNSSLCKPLAGPAAAEQEFFMFATAAQQNWKLYPWQDLTTVAVAGWDGVTSDMVCKAHETSTRVVILTSMPKDQVANASLRSQWVAATTAAVRASGLDGVNVDFEDFVLASETGVRNGLVALTQELRSSLDAAGREDGGTYQLSWDFAWSPDGLDGNCGIDERCYPYADLAASVDLGFVMAYDMRSQVFGPGPCRAYANSPRDLVSDGMDKWAAVAPSTKLVLGLPLYGYRYDCLPGTAPDASLCQINTTLWRNATCSDAVGSEHNAYEVATWLAANSSTGWRWDADAASPWFNYVEEDTGAVHQVWYDDPASIGIKAARAGAMGWRGTGAWHMDAVFGPGLSADAAQLYLRALQAV